MITYRDIAAARRRIAPYICHTPLEPALSLSGPDMPVFLKLECHQRTRSFKLRGALSCLTAMTPAQRRQGVVAVSSGNHGIGLSLAARLLGVETTVIYVPETAPRAKVERIRYYGAEVRRTGRNYDEAYRNAMEAMPRSGLTFVDSSADPAVIAGQGTIAPEILEDEPSVDTILVPIGGGGIITGIAVAAKALKPGIRIVGVQTEACPAMLRAIEDNRLYEQYPTCGESLCDALVGGVAEIPFRMAKEYIDEILLVSEAGIREATIRLLTREKVAAEPSSATVAAAVAEHPACFKGHVTAAVVTGGNLDGGLMRRLLG